MAEMLFCVVHIFLTHLKWWNISADPVAKQNTFCAIQRSLDSSDSLMIVCTVNNMIAGNCQLVRRDGVKTRHRATVMIALLQDFWGLGIGSAMFSEMELAAKELGISQLELEMIEGNARAMALYQKMGFTVMAEHPDAIRLKDGSSRKAVFMRKVIG